MTSLKKVSKLAVDNDLRVMSTA